MSIFYEDGAEFSSSIITTGPPSSSISSSAPLASAAATGGHFTWSATWRASVTSRQWTTTKKANIYIRVAPIENCKSTTKPQLSLDRLTTGRVGTVRQVPCAGGTYVWSMVDPGKFTFLLTGLVKPNAALYYSTSGAVGYDGSGA